MDTSFLILNKGKIRINRSLSTRKNVTFISDGGELTIGKGVFFNCNCTITSCSSIKIGNHCSFGPNVVIVDHDHNYKKVNNDDMFISSPVIIGNNVWIGANAVILRGTTIGDNSIIGAGAIIKEHIPENSIVFSEKKLKFIENNYAKE
jgi:acetyltransferase-like isoleucine patch superfamily enzyme